MTLIRYPQDRRDAKIRGEWIALENTARPGGEDFPSAPNTHVTSFVLLDGDAAVRHAGVRRSALRHRGETYWAYGLSEVATHPQYQRRGDCLRGDSQGGAVDPGAAGGPRHFSCGPLPIGRRPVFF